MEIDTNNPSLEATVKVKPDFILGVEGVSSRHYKTLSIPVGLVLPYNSLVETLGFQETVPPDLDKQDADLFAPISLELLLNLFSRGPMSQSDQNSFISSVLERNDREI